MLCYLHYVTGFTNKDGISWRRKRRRQRSYLLHKVQQQKQEGPKQEVRNNQIQPSCQNTHCV